MSHAMLLVMRTSSLLSIAFVLVLGCDAGTPAAADSGSSRIDVGPRPDTGITPGGEHYFPAGAIWTTDVYDAAPASDSEAQIAGAARGRRLGQRRHVADRLLDRRARPPTRRRRCARSRRPTTSTIPTAITSPMPVPAGGNVEGESGYACTSDGDCHLIVFDAGDEQALRDVAREHHGTARSTAAASPCGTRPHVRTPTTLRGEQCTSADAAGFPIAPLLFTADEVAAGHIDHAIRFILPNDRVAKGYVAAGDARHATRPAARTRPSYGVHLRLRADYPIDTLPSEGARVVARAMQKYGMYHADGGNIALTAQSDRHTTAKWDGLLGAAATSRPSRSRTSRSSITARRSRDVRLRPRAVIKRLTGRPATVRALRALPYASRAASTPVE